MDNSRALAFYVRHPEAVDALYECSTRSKSAFKDSANKSNLPGELIEVTLKRWNTWIAIERCLEQDRAKFEGELLDQLSERLNKIVKVMKKSTPEWGGELTFRQKNGGKAPDRAPASVGWDFGTYGEEVLLRPWVWARGGRVAEKRILGLLTEWAGENPNRKMAADLDWDTGSVMVDEIRLSCYLSKSNETLDVDRLTEDFMTKFDWVDKNRMESIIALADPRSS